jgi:hypothetical protein
MLDWMPNGSLSQISIIQNEQEGYCVAAGIEPFPNTTQIHMTYKVISLRNKDMKTDN